MEGYQFAHMDLWSRKGRTGCPEGGTEKRHNGQTAWTVAQILDEAERRLGACDHIIPGRPPLEVLPGAVSSIAALRNAHDQASSVREKAFTSAVVDGEKRRTGKTRTVQRKLRSDASTLYTCIVSLPVLAADALSDPSLREECMAVLRGAMEHERARIEDLGGTLACGVVHWDEEMVHAHLYGLDMIVGRVDHLHPGRVAKAAYYADHEDSGLPGKDRARNANRRYREAMRAWQDDLHADVFRDAGLLRYGPRRGRETRAEYLAAKKAAAERAADAKRQAEIRDGRRHLKTGWERLSAATTEHDEILAEAEAALAEERSILDAERGADGVRKLSLDRREAALVSRDADVAAREGKAAAAEEKAEEALARAGRKEVEAEASLAAAEALVAGFLEVQCDGEESKLVVAEAAKSDPLWPGLRARIKPASQVAAAFARRLETSLRSLRERARDEGLAKARTQAREEARAELAGVRAALERAIAMAGRIGVVARRFAAKLAPSDQAAMLAEIEAASRAAAKAQITARLEDARAGAASGDRPHRRGDAHTG